MSPNYTTNNTACETTYKTANDESNPGAGTGKTII
jgi:hypothetical protein